MQQAIVADEMARVNAPPTINGLGIGIVGPTIIVHGTEAQKQRYLKKILAAEELWCQLYSEPNAGSDLASLKTRADDKGEHFEVTGQKIWTSGGLIADWGLLLARTDPTEPKHKGISCFLLNMRQPGVEVRPLKQITGSAHFSEVFMTEARVEKSDLIGRLGQGWEIAQTTLSYERGGNSLARVTRYASAVNQLVKAARELSRGGPPLIDDPLVRTKMGRLYAELEVQPYSAPRVLSALQKDAAPTGRKPDGLRLQPGPAPPQELGPRLPRRALPVRPGPRPGGRPPWRERGDVERHGPARLARVGPAPEVRRQRARHGQNRHRPRGDGAGGVSRSLLPHDARRRCCRPRRERRAEEPVAAGDRDGQRAGDRRLPRRPARLGAERVGDRGRQDGGRLDAHGRQALRAVGPCGRRAAGACPRAGGPLALPRGSRGAGPQAHPGHRHGSGNALDLARAGRRPRPRGCPPRRLRPGGGTAGAAAPARGGGRGGRDAGRRPPLPRHERRLCEGARTVRPAHRLLPGDPPPVRRDAPGGRELACGDLLRRLGERRGRRGRGAGRVGGQGLRRGGGAEGVRRGDPGARREWRRLGGRPASLLQTRQSARAAGRARRLPSRGDR